jgi:hypothetical protein
LSVGAGGVQRRGDFYKPYQKDFTEKIGPELDLEIKGRA